MKLNELNAEKVTELMKAYNSYTSWNFGNEPISFDELKDKLDEDGFLSLAISERREHEVQTFYDFNGERLVYYADGEAIDSEPFALDDFIYWIEDADCDDDVLAGCESALSWRYAPLEQRAKEILGESAMWVTVGCGCEKGTCYYVDAVDHNYGSTLYYVDDIEELSKVSKGKC